MLNFLRRRRRWKILEDWKIKIAVLWLVFAAAGIWIPVIENYIPGYLEEALAQTTPESVLMLVVIEMIFPVMALLSLTLKDTINRWLNIIMGIVSMVLVLIGLSGGFPAAYLPSLIVIVIVEFVAAALIVWHAWKSKPKA
jgi:hypothetical protein